MPIKPKMDDHYAGKTRVIRGVIANLVKGRWHGDDRLTEGEAAAQFKVSRTPVREALLELSAMGIVKLKRNCGAVLLPFGVVEVKNLYAIRSLLEVEATRLAAKSMGRDIIEDLKSRFESLRIQRLPDQDWQLDRELHAAIAQASGNPRLADEIARYSTVVQTMREAVSGVLTHIHSTSLADHLDILHHLRQRHPHAAAAAMHAHLIQASNSAVQAVTNLTKDA